MAAYVLSLFAILTIIVYQIASRRDIGNDFYEKKEGSSSNVILYKIFTGVIGIALARVIFIFVVGFFTNRRQQQITISKNAHETVPSKTQVPSKAAKLQVEKKTVQQEGEYEFKPIEQQTTFGAVLQAIGTDAIVPQLMVTTVSSSTKNLTHSNSIGQA